MVDVRRAHAGDVDVLAGVLARAFSDDPVAAYLFPDPARSPEQLRLFFTLQLRRSYLPFGEVLTTDARDGAALWMPPRAGETVRPGSLTRLRLMTLLGRRLLPARDLVRLLAAHHPPERYYYLGTIGTEPARQGKGVGSALMRAVLARCDSGGHPAYLECSRIENVAFYQHHGFEVATEVSAPRSGPRLWLMWRHPAGATPRPTS